MLTLLVIPTFYEMLTDVRDWLGERLLRRKPVGHEKKEESSGPARTPELAR